MLGDLPRTSTMTVRAARLLHLLDELRRRRTPVQGAKLAGLLGVSLRTLYLSLIHI